MGKVKEKIKNLPELVLGFLSPLKPLVVLFPLFAFFYSIVWQGLTKARLTRQIHERTATKEELKRKNDELKIGIVTYTSAERIETLYRRTYQFLPISLGNRTVTIELPPIPEKGLREEE
ncbi:hypothetical protein ND861_05590 [Leptospira sp. 2 VSF19]|uniref:Septum formation initiator n=1 Tax=Leptospira soteropolitanensis TaxID=2950025 RepID=A0AAW5VBB4_9LEPT|nr:hypothetical protein [Leptospira soteropolitanensis]MCW7492126.1 hypothetical protein [Leptospira soteropolitanensis]MCW7499708.1 hypothetical protein [Leptospira soteropolitanensis]MCW7521959.1 hypothetical protein [Leptospira soteropolitanensis]MCW7525813.1 hypothetical protein [Leptospira soteropolitanensis]MCW7530073.1 hypothetical protein [Leptospira soteropolitanensis]